MQAILLSEVEGLGEAGTVVTGTAYRGAAAEGGTKWWQGWTTFAVN